MNETLSELSARFGIEDFYISANGEYRSISDETKLGILAAMGVNEDRPQSGVESFEDNNLSRNTDGDDARCFVPDWLNGGRVWGLTTQLYGIRSGRNQGIGDFEDLARLTELAAKRGADFIGVNPLHALFWGDPDRCSPYFPSTRRFLNPLYIAVDAVPGGEAALRSLDPSVLDHARRADTVDYKLVSRIKRALLRGIFDATSSSVHPSFLQFCEEEGDSLEQFARFETVSDVMANVGAGAGWPNWPQELQDSRSQEVCRLVAEEQQTLLWHKWMQWLARDQLAEVQRRAREAGMRIGLYLDVAVGVAPDGAATWADPDLVTAKARIGCPPDAFNPLGQDWGLAPIIPPALLDRALAPFEEVVKSAMKFAGAVRIDHVMGLEHLYWIPEGRDARQGGYVRYPRELMLRCLGDLSRTYRAIVIGEDLGTVPRDFRDRMLERSIHSYRVFYFERDGHGDFADLQTYPEVALACVGTHDLPTLDGWWAGTDIATRLGLGLITQEDADAENADRSKSREQLLSMLNARDYENGSDAESKKPAHQVVIGVHAHVASCPSRFFAAQLDDLVGATEQINMPGTHTEYPNWRYKLPVKLEDLFAFPLAAQTLDAIARVRPRQS